MVTTEPLPVDPPTDPPPPGDPPPPVDTPADPPPADPPAEIVYTDFTVPEGITLIPEFVDEFKALAKESKLDQATAQKFMDLGAKSQLKMVEGFHAMHEQRKADWLKAAEADEELAADMKLGDQSAALRAFNTIAGDVPGAKAMVDELGIGNHPEFIRIFFRLSQRMREGDFDTNGRTGGATKSKADIMYGGSGQ